MVLQSQEKELGKTIQNYSLQQTSFSTLHLKKISRVALQRKFKENQSQGYQRFYLANPLLSFGNLTMLSEKGLIVDYEDRTKHKI